MTPSRRIFRDGIGRQANEILSGHNGRLQEEETILPRTKSVYIMDRGTSWPTEAQSGEGGD